MEEANGTYMHDRYAKIWLESLQVMSSIDIFAMQEGSLAGWTTHQPDQQDWYNVHMLLIWIKKTNKKDHCANYKQGELIVCVWDNPKATL